MFILSFPYMRLRSLLLLLGIAVVVTQCSTKKNTLINRTYHNLTAHYNGYFYAKESMKEGIVKLEKLHDDNYDNVLSVFKYGDEKKVKNIYPEMDRAIEKASLVIQRHEIKAKPTHKRKKKGKRKKKRKKKKKKGKTENEYKTWIDDSYFLIGQARFYKHDFYAAIETFEYVAKKYKKDPIKYDAMLWMVKSYNELGNFTEAQSIIDLLNDKKNRKNISNKLRAKLTATYADFYIKQKIYPPAIKQLQKSIALTKKKTIRTRYMYILAQIYQRQGDYKRASRYFGEVLKMNPSYDMAFKAKINMAKGVSARNNKEIKKELEKMLRDEKNNEYFDQIYYTLADIVQKEGDIKASIEYLELSVMASISNDHQKGLSFLRLADIYFNKPDYQLSKPYYDSAATFLSQDYPDYLKIVNKKNSLTDIVKYLNIIAYEDSVQRLAAMSSKERDKIIKELIAKVIEEEEQKREEQETESSLLPQQTNQTSRGTTGSIWYFYNPAAISFGYSEFLKKWGIRKLEDNWRRINKRTISPEGLQDFETEDEQEDDPGQITGNLKDVNSYLKNIPLTRIQMQESHNRIIDALYNLGITYKELLLDKKQSAKTFEELLKRYAENKYRLSTCYYLYRLYLSLGNNVRAEYYKNIILNEYPNSDYAKLIRNPGYIKELEAEKNKIERYYKTTYGTYIRGQYELVLSRCGFADSLFPSNALMPKFDYLKALCIGKTRDVAAFETALKKVVKKHPKDEVKTQAEAILAMIAKLNDSFSDTLNTTPGDTMASIYKFNKNAIHYYILVVVNENADINRLKTNVSDYNSKFFRMENLKIENMLFGNEDQLVVIKNYANKENRTL